LKWGLIGTRGYAARAAAPGISKSERGELVAVLGRDSAAATEFAAGFGAAAATYLDEFLATPGLEAVWIASPTWRHQDQTVAALKAGKHVLCEKPLADGAKQAWDMVDAARRAGKVLATGYQGRYVPGHRAMQELIRNGAIGDVTTARSYYGVHRSGPPPEWRRRVDTAGWGALADLGTHHIDVQRMLLGEITDAHGITAHQLEFETEDVGAAAFRFASGALATLTVTVNVWRESTRVEVHGTKGMLVATDTNPAARGDVYLYDAENSDGRDVTGEKPESIWALQVDAITAAAEGENVPYATGEDGARGIEILELLSPH
jgi:1,5-anhydro-D-fructose reductase (1,5-anhydro-D-mannitol-forming)